MKKRQTHTPTLQLPGVGKQIAKHLARLDIHSVQDLLFHFPSRYQDRTKLQTIRSVLVGEEAVIEGIVQTVINPPRGRTKLLCELRDHSGRVHLRFFHLMPFQLNTLTVGTRLRCYGVPKLGQTGLEIVHPEFQVIAEGKTIPVEQFLTPIYPATEGLSQYSLRKLTTNALSWMSKEETFNEMIPASLLSSLSFPSLKEALSFLHRPPRETKLEHLHENKTQAQKRLIFEELLTHRLSLLHLKRSFQLQKSFELKKSQSHEELFYQQLAFQLTNAQKRVLQEVQRDLAQPHPMLRLVQGDVGSGKTVIAALSMLQAVANGYQALMIAPTELLAEQHYRVFKKWFDALSIELVFLSGNVKGRARASALTAIENGNARIILGTHALFQTEVKFAKLALIVIDEHHRFGVHQRALLREKGEKEGYHPHQLIMTATPIPRTLAMSFYADLDCSTIDELPPGRTPIVTSVVANSKREEVIAHIQNACRDGRQAYWVCPLIDESEVLSCQAATKTAEALQLFLKDMTVGLLHGRMSAAEKEKMMAQFQAGEIQLLVATTVIEVGVDVANASIMIIENAERLGLSQLHQLRGRVGRGQTKSHCVLLYEYLSPLARERLSVMRETTDGFKIAQRDLELRGPGEVLGIKQTGELSFRVADLIRDNDILPSVQKAADHIMREHADIIEPLMQRWLGSASEYGKV